ncbi:MAG: hypothetical protein ACR5LG_04065 [Sodalis sp. (in: enterobacteria)]|uniref:hypothetical protein n=1 Tax=Sodalis sp. (in: enterobacteria) TaxID=1898979 RepID=UPI003F400A6C
MNSARRLPRSRVANRADGVLQIAFTGAWIGICGGVQIRADETPPLPMPAEK